MRYVLAILAVTLTGCATPEQRAQAMLDEFGPVCAVLGFKAGTQEYSQCVLQSATADQQRRMTVYHAIMTKPKP